MSEVKVLPRPGTKARQVYDVLAEYPGVKTSTQEVTDELGLTTRFASATLTQLWKYKKIQRSGKGAGRHAEALWWVAE